MDTFGADPFVMDFLTPKHALSEIAELIEDNSDKIKATNKTGRNYRTIQIQRS